MRKILLAGIAMLLTVVGANAALIPAFEYSTATIDSDISPYTAGFQFSLSTATTVEALGFYNDGQPFSHDVGIWNAGGTLIAQTTVLPTDVAVGHFRYGMITPITLGPGTYTIGGQVYEGGTTYNVPVNLLGVTTIPQYTWIADEQVFGPGLVMPTLSAGGYGNNGIASVNFAIATPEPASMLLLGAGLFGLAGIRRRKAE